MKLAKITAALVVAGLAMPALAGPKEIELLNKLTARLEKLEARNAELEKKLEAAGAPWTPGRAIPVWRK